MAKKAKVVSAGEQPAAQVEVKPAKPVVQYVLGAKAPKHRAGHNAKAWEAIVKHGLPATFSALSELPETGACNATGKGGHLFVSYAIRRGWLAPQA